MPPGDEIRMAGVAVNIESSRHSASSPGASSSGTRSFRQERRETPPRPLSISAPVYHPQNMSPAGRDRNLDVKFLPQSPRHVVMDERRLSGSVGIVARVASSPSFERSIAASVIASNANRGNNEDKDNNNSNDYAVEQSKGDTGEPVDAESPEIPVNPSSATTPTNRLQPLSISTNREPHGTVQRQPVLHGDAKDGNAKAAVVGSALDRPWKSFPSSVYPLGDDDDDESRTIVCGFSVLRFITSLVCFVVVAACVLAPILIDEQTNLESSIGVDASTVPSMAPTQLPTQLPTQSPTA